MRESLCTQLIIWVDTILKHIDTRAILPRYERVLAWYKDPNGIENIINLNYLHPTSIIIF